MPLSTTLRKLVCCAAGRQEEEAVEAPAGRPRPEPAQAARPRPEPAQAGRPWPEPAQAGRPWPDPAQAGRPWPEPAQAAAVEPGRPYSDFVEDEAREFWQEMVQAGRLTKPDLQEIRTAALPILCRAQRGRQGRKINPALNRARMAVDAMHLHALERRWIKPPYTGLQASDNYVEALIQLAHDAGWLAREIPLQAHRGLQHPPVYFMLDPVSKRAVPREDALIRGDYVFDPADGSRITEDQYIHPWRDPCALPSKNALVSRGWNACYSLSGTGDRMQILYYSLTGSPENSFLKLRIDRFFSLPGVFIHFSPYPPSRRELTRYRRSGNRILPGAS